MALRSTIALILFGVAVSEKLTYVPSKLDKVVYIYPENVKKDKDLKICESGEVCGVVNQRFWLPPHVHRFCQCAKTLCPFTWSDLEANNARNDNRSIPLDNRSQVKVCEDVRTMMPCERTTVAMTVTETLETEQTKSKRDIKILCSCSWPAYWRLNLRDANKTVIYSEYICSPLERCSSEQFCGHMRADTYSTYYQCSCPRDHICINTDKQVRNVTELLYQGPMMRAYCFPTNNAHRKNVSFPTDNEVRAASPKPKKVWNKDDEDVQGKNAFSRD